MSIKRVWILAVGLLTLAAFGVQAQMRGGGNGGGGMRAAGAAAGGGFHASFAARQPVTINMGRPSSGFRNNFPSRQGGQAQAAARPAWGHVNWSASAPAQAPAARSGRPASGAWPSRSGQSERPAVSSRVPAGTLSPARGTRMASAQHHHPYTQGYVRHKLRNLGVSSEPALITDRSQMIHTDAAHSTLAYPTRGPKGAALDARVLDPRTGADAALMKTQMARVNDPGWRANVESYNTIETRSGHYYWHHDSGFNYCHYLDSSGYQWYGWYAGGTFFWTRDFAGRWWWYDQADSRWDFYNDGFWWWQDPDHVGDLYCYDNGGYIPANSAEDPIVVSQPDTSDFTVFTSPDGTRTVKLVAGGADAFLYDNGNPPAFDPIYLASGVESVQFSDTSNGRPLEIMLKLDDGSFDLLDAQGQPYGPGQYDGDAAGYDGQGATSEGGEELPTGAGQ